MPSCAKLEKRASAEVVPVDNNTPIRQVIVAVEHKIRNLEKRKGKLESYRDLQKSGKDLTADQKIAVSKYDEVTQCLDFAKELFKQVHAISAMWEKDQKKVVRKETANRIQSEVTKVKEVLVIQDTLESLRDEQAREDFLTGSNGAAKLEQKELELLDKLYVSSTVKRVPGSNLDSYLACAQKAADHLISTVDGKPKSFCDTNYERVRNILQVVQNSGYFDKQFNGGEKISVAAAAATAEEVIEDTGETIVKNGGVETPPEVEREVIPVVPQVVPPPTTFPPSAEQQQQQLGQATMVPQILLPQPITTIIPAAVSVVSTAMAGAPSPMMPNPEYMNYIQNFKQHQHQQYIQHIRPGINELIGGSTYNFLQDSELDSPDVIVTSAPVQQQQQQPAPPPVTVASAPIPAVPIATQTFTNQNFSAMTPPVPAAPPVLVPAPDHHIPGFATAPRPIVPAPQPPVAAAVQVQPIPQPSPENPKQQQQQVEKQPLPQRKIVEESPPPVVEEPPLQISEWNPEESGAVVTTTKKSSGAADETSANWADQVNESKEWNSVDASGNNSDNQFGGSWQAEGTTSSSSGGGYGGGRRGFGGGMRRRGGHGGGGNNMGYRSSRQNQAYHQNSGGNRTGSTFYRNNDPNYYQNQNGGGSSSSGGGYHNGSGSSYKSRASNMRPNMGRGDRSHSNRRENTNRPPQRSSGGYTGPTRNSAPQND